MNNLNPVLMKKSLFLSLIAAMITIACTQEKKSPIEGAWKIVSWEHMKGDSIAWTFPGNYTGGEMLVFTKNHFLWVGRYKKDSTYISNYGGGTFKLEGNKLEEKIEYSVDQSMVGSTIRLLWELKNDTATQTWPQDENWNLKKEDYGIQKWIKLE